MQHAWRSRYEQQEKKPDSPAHVVDDMEMLFFLHIRALYSSSIALPTLTRPRAIFMPSATPPDPWRRIISRMVIGELLGFDEGQEGPELPQLSSRFKPCGEAE